MQLLDALEREHALIERVALSFLGYASGLATASPRETSDTAPPQWSPRDGAAYARFFEVYVGRYHHGREEGTLFPALAEQTEAPTERGPLRVMLEAHRSMARMKDELAALLAAGPAGRDDAERLAALANRFVRALLLHIDAENGVLFPESDARFRRACVAELPDRPPDADEAAAAADAEALVARHPPAKLPDLVRGGTCTTCEAFGAGCDGLEREWSSDLEWDDMIDRVG